jgi:hypothetical protein
MPDIRSIYAIVVGWQYTLFALALDAVREAFALA